MTALVIRGATLIDPTGERRADVAIDPSGLIAAVETEIDAAGMGSDVQVIDAAGCVVTPGFVDLHSHLREPGKEEAETIESGSRCAALGGYTAILAMPNTSPAIDCAAVVRQVLELGAASLVDVHTSGAITMGRRGDALAPMAEMAALGVRVFTDDGAGVQDDRLMRRAMEYALGLRGRGLPVLLAQHCETESLAEGGHMHEGEWSSRLGIAGQPAESEELMVMRDLALAKLTGAVVHFQHLSTAGSVELVRRAKAAGLPCTAEATTHHFTLTHAECATYDATFKVNPPLRTTEDVAAIKAGFADGTIDCIATDHAPHTAESKEAPFDQAPPGMLGLETAMALGLTELDVPIAKVFELLSWKPAEILGISAVHGGAVRVGTPANLCVVDPAAEWVIDPAKSASRSRNNPYRGRKVRGRVRHTIVHGEAVVLNGEAQR